MVLGDKERPELTKHLNEGHVVDMAELNDASDGTSRLNELKVYSGLSKHYDGGRGSTLNGGTPTSVGHLYAFGNTEERLRLGNLGSCGLVPVRGPSIILKIHRRSTRLCCCVGVGGWRRGRRYRPARETNPMHLG